MTRTTHCLLLLLTVGCGVSSIKVTDLVGTYSVRYQHGSETLFLKAGGDFTQVYTPLGDQQSITNSGKWEFVKRDRAILLRDAVEFDGWGVRENRSLNKIVWQIRIAKRFGKINLVIGEPGVLEYDKTN